MTNINRTGTQHSKPAGDSPFPRDMAPKPPDQRKLGGKSDGTRRLAQERYPKSAGDFDRLIAQASTGQGQVNAPEYSEENAGIWRNIATDAARPIITRFTVSPTVFDNILCKADGVTYNTDIGRGECDGDLVLFLRSVQEEVVYRESLVSPFSKKRFHDTPEGVAALAEIDAEAIARGLKGAASVGSFRRDILGCPAPDFKASADEAHDRLHKWIEAHPVEVKSAPATTPALALALEVPVVADASGVIPITVTEPHNDAPITMPDTPPNHGDDSDDFVTPAPQGQAAMQAAGEALAEQPTARSFFLEDEARSAFFAGASQLLKEANIPMTEQPAFMRAALGVATRKDYMGTPGQAMESIKSAITERNKSQMAADTARRGRAMSLICPSGNGSIVYKGIRYMRQAAEIADPADLLLGLQEWVTWWASVEALGIAPDANCKAHPVPPPATTSFPPREERAKKVDTREAAQPQAAAAPTGNGEVKRDKATWLIKETKLTAQGPVSTYELRPTINGNMGQYQIVRVRNDRDLKSLAAALAESEIDADALTPGTHQCNLEIEWKHGKETAPGSGKFYRDIVSIKAV